MAPRITRSYRIDPEAWEVANQKARDAGVPLSSVIELFLRAWAEGLLPLPTEKTTITVDYSKKEEE